LAGAVDDLLHGEVGAAGLCQQLPRRVDEPAALLDGPGALVAQRAVDGAVPPVAGHLRPRHRMRGSIRLPDENEFWPSSSASFDVPSWRNTLPRSVACLGVRSRAAHSVRSVACTASGGWAAMVSASRWAASCNSAAGTTSLTNPASMARSALMRS